MSKSKFQESILRIAAGALVLFATSNAWPQGKTGDAKKQADAKMHVAVVFSGGHETEPRDGGRPVVLIAAGLGVPPDVFRSAFSKVKPAPAGQRPKPEQVRKNKQVLLSALGKYGITNEKLDKVSDYYRYMRSRGELWPTKPATANALVENGKIVGFEITNGGAGYSSPPKVTVEGFKDVKVDVQLSFGKKLETNGSISAITLAKEKSSKSTK